MEIIFSINVSFQKFLLNDIFAKFINFLKNWFNGNIFLIQCIVLKITIKKDISRHYLIQIILEKYLNCIFKNNILYLSFNY